MSAPCVRCGLCCMVQTCEYGRKKYGVLRNSACPGLTHQNTTAVCPEFPIADAFCGFVKGCGMDAVVLIDGVRHTWESLPPKTKRECARMWRERKEKAA